MTNVTTLSDLAVASLGDAFIYAWLDGAPDTQWKIPLAQVMGLTRGINSQVGTAYTLALTDLGGLVTMNNAAANTVTVPLNATVAFPLGSKIDVSQYGEGQTTIAPEGSVTIRAADGLKLGARYAGATLVKIGTNEWMAFGRLVA